MTDGNLDALNWHLAECEARDEQQDMETELQELRDDNERLTAELAAAERRERQLLDTTETCRMLRRELNTAKAKLVEVEAGRDRWSFRADTHAARAVAAKSALAEAENQLDSARYSVTVLEGRVDHFKARAEAALVTARTAVLESVGEALAGMSHEHASPYSRALIKTAIERGFATQTQEKADE